MRTLSCMTAFLIIALQPSIHGSASSPNSQQASEVVKEQLCGLNYVDLVVYIESLNIKNGAVIGERIGRAASWETRMAISPGILYG